jgi:hypothetical protein
MSVVVVTRNTFSSIRRTVRFLHAQTAADRIELILVGPEDSSCDDRRPAETAGFAAVVIVAAGPIDDVDRASASGIRRASAPIVGLVEDHAFPEPEWAEALIAAHAGPWAAVGSAFANGNPGSALSWANLLLAYGSWTEPVRGGETRNVSRHNISYKREALRPHLDDLENLIGRGGALLATLLAEGHSFYMEPGARIAHLNVSRLAPTVALRLDAGRLYAHARARQEGWSFAKRALYVALWPLVPVMRIRPLLPKIAGNGLGNRARGALGFAVLLDGLGQTVGYALGPGGARERLVAMEFDRGRMMRPAERRHLAGG